MPQSSEELCRETSAVHYPELFRRIVMIVDEGEDGIQIGSGVMVNVEGRHFVATAGHCIQQSPRILREELWDAGTKRMAPRASARIIWGGVHEELDLGFLEIAEPTTPEIGEGQIFNEATRLIEPRWSLHIIGYPVRTRASYEHLRMRTIQKKAFISNAIEQSDAYIKIAYPKIGYRLENEKWAESPFVETPHGFSGGGCFVITEHPSAVPMLGHKLIGIQSSWSPDGRWVKVIPIKPWYDMVKGYLRSGHP